MSFFEPKLPIEKKILAVHDEHLEQVLSDLGLLDSVKAGQVRCANCGAVITLENLQSIYSKDSELRLTCSSADCRQVVEATDAPETDQA